jgi:hypothetical protein
MTDTPTSDLCKYETLLLMIATAAPEFAFRRANDEMSCAVVHDLMLMNTVIAQFVVINEIECRKAIPNSEPRPLDIQLRRRVVRGACDEEWNQRCGHLLRRDETCKLAELSGGTDVDAFKKYLQKEAAATFSAACNRRLDKLAHEKGKQDLGARIVRLENDISRAKMEMDNANTALHVAEVACKMTLEALKKVEDVDDDEVKVF